MSHSPYPQVVRVFTTRQRPNYDTPWQTLGVRTATGSGVVIAPRLIVTGAHVVADATFIQVQETHAPDKAIARVVCLGHDCDLALLTVDDDAFWRDLPIAQLDDLPQLRDKVQVVGFPTGGEELSITEGVVSRLEVQHYSHSKRNLLALTVDAAINAGNSGGPVFRGDKVVGIAFQALKNAENIGELVPAVFIRRLLEAAAKGRDLQVPSFGLSIQTLENPTLHRSLGLAPQDSGLLISHVLMGGSAEGLLRPGDVLTHIDHLAIANNGTVRYRGRWRTSFSVVLADHHVGDELPLRVWRDGAALDLRLTLKAHTGLVPASLYDRPTRWFLYGGLIFQPLSLHFLRTWTKWQTNAPRRLVELYYSGLPTAERRELVVISGLLADALNAGYEDAQDDTVRSVNGVPVRDLPHLFELLHSAQGLVRLHTDLDLLIVFDADEVRATQPRILERYRLPSAHSAELGEPGEPIA